jgi:hypothetical protein
MEIRHLRCSKIDGGLIKYETIYSRFDKFQFGPQDSTSDGTFNSFFKYILLVVIWLKMIQRD